jgi:DNA-binding GntR family transcriptional regulator
MRCYRADIDALVIDGGGPVSTRVVAVSPESLGTRAAAVLREAIVSGQLLPGTRIVEIQMAEQLGVSRGTLRQALRELEHAGLVISSPYRGTYVAELTPHALRAAYEVRGLLEGFAATQIPVDAMPGILAVMRDRLEAMRQALAAGRATEVAAIDIDFHAPICTAASNGRLTQLWDALSGPLQARYANQIEVLYTPEEIIARHEAIIALLAAGTPMEIEAGIRAHYMETARRMAAEMDAISSDNGGTR